MFAKIKLYAIIALGFVTAILYGLYNREKAQRQRDKARAAKASLDTLHKANSGIEQADKQGKDDVKKALDKADTGDRSHFE